MCKHWNGSMGPEEVTARLGGFFKIEYNEKEQCFKLGFEKQAWAHCGDFEPRYFNILETETRCFAL